MCIRDSHTVEDTGIVLGQALKQALGEKTGIRRFGAAFVPMDEALCFTALDFSNRPFLVFDAEMPQGMIGGYDFWCSVSPPFIAKARINSTVKQES